MHKLNDKKKSSHLNQDEDDDFIVNQDSDNDEGDAIDAATVEIFSSLIAKIGVAFKNLDYYKSGETVFNFE